MTAIVNNVGDKPNIIKFNGEEYDLQLNMYVISQFENFDAILNSLGRVETVFKMLTAMMNADTKKHQYDRPILDADYVAACTLPAEMPAYSEAIAKALGYREKTAEEKEIEEALADVEVPEKN